MRVFIFFILLIGILFAFGNVYSPVIFLSPEPLAISPTPVFTPPEDPTPVTTSDNTIEVTLPASEPEIPTLPTTTPPLEEIAEIIASPIPTQKDYLPSTIIRERTEESIINFLCKTNDGGSISATGIIISTDGHILSNAHVSENLKENECLVRTGSPARNFAYAELLFIPQKYTDASTDFTRATYDISIWKIIRPVGSTLLPETFPSLAIDYSTVPEANDQFAVLSYPAEVFGAKTILRSLPLLFTNTEVVARSEFFVETKNSLSSQKGSSGGALIDRETTMLRGVIFGVSDAELVAERKLFSLLPDWISLVVKEETSHTLQEYINL